MKKSINWLWYVIVLIIFALGSVLSYLNDWQFLIWIWSGALMYHIIVVPLLYYKLNKK
jgi:hypothetical protein